MTITIDHVLAALVGVPCIISLAKTSDNPTRLAAAVCLLCAIGVVVAPVFTGYGVHVEVGRIGWVACGVASIITGVRVANGILSTLIITGGVLGALLSLNVIAGG